MEDLVAVIDLDDTLYWEFDYLLSGVRAACDEINALYGVDLHHEMTVKAHERGADLWGWACERMGFSAGVKDQLLWTYRLHDPHIELRPGAAETLSLLEARCRAVAILTDGRSFSQRKKLAALNLSHLPAYVSEETGFTKPEPGGFRAIMERWPGSRYAYVADNPRKDFIAPNALGWRTVGLIGGERNIHSQACADLPSDYLPRLWAETWPDVATAFAR